MNRKKRMMLVLISLLLFLVILNPRSIKYLQKKFLGEEQNVINIMELKLPHSNQMVYKKFGDHLLQYWDGILYSYNMDGSQNWSLNLGISNPLIEVSEKSIYVVDKGKKQVIRISEKGEVIYRTTSKKDIGFINGDDEVLLVHHSSEDGILRSLTILNDEGKQSGEIVINDGEVISTSVSSVDERIILNTVGVSGGNIQSKLITYSLKGELIELKEINDQLILNMFFDASGNIITAYENKIASIKSNQEVNWEINTEKLIMATDLSGEYIIVYSGEGKNSILKGRSREKIQVIDLKGNIIGESKPDETIMGIDHYNDEFISYSDRSIYLFDKNAEMLMEHKFSVDIEEAFLLPDRHIAIISKEKLGFMKIQ